MSHARKFIQSLLTYLFLLSLILSLIQPGSASAQTRDGIKRQVDPATGKVNFISSASGHPLAASQVLGLIPDRAADPALTIAQHFGPEFGLANAAHELKVIHSTHAENGRVTVRYQQEYQGVPVMAAELIVNTNDQGDFYSMNGEVASDLSLPTQPTIGPEQARQIALQAAAKWYRKTTEDFVTSTPTLWIFDESLLKPSQRPAELIWRMEVTPVNPFVPVRELVLVNAQRGSISLHFNQIDAGTKNIGTFGLSSSESTAHAVGLNDSVSASPLAVSPNGGYRQTYTANHGETLPGQLLCNQTTIVCTNGNNPDADKAHMYAAETWNFYHDHHGRDSIDSQGMTIISTVEYSSNFLNAFWDGTQMVYGDDMVSDDIVGHELSHGVTQYESNLFYYYQSGAINESFSDVWGELMDQSNTSGNDAAEVKWQIGEDSPVGAFRSMSDPTLFGDPDSITSPNYDTDPLFQDNGGVHHNSGVNNKAVYLMVAGGSFGGKAVTALGVSKTLAVYYEAQTNLLTSGADYADLYGALYQACLNLVGGTDGITNANCQEVRDATDAVGMNAQPSSDPNFNTDAPFCDSNLSPQAIFSDDMESDTSKWIFGSIVGGNRWQLDSPAVYGPNAHSGLHSLYAYDLPATVTDTFARLKTAVSIPAGAFLHFSQAYGFEDYFFLGTFDGGVLEYSSNGGAWVDAGSLFVNNGYNGTVDSGYDNPLGGRSAFVGDSHGYISSRVNLNSLANQNVIFRWRMGLDTGGNDFGWWLDDVQIYTCSSTPNTATNTPTRTATSTPTATRTPTSTPTSTRTNTPTATRTSTPTFTPTNTPTSTQTNTPITIPFVSSIILANTNPTNAPSVGFIVAFSKSVTGVDTSDFSLTTTDTTGASIAGVTGSGATRTVTVNTGSGNGTIRLDVVDDDSIKDAANNPLGGVGLGNGNFTNGETYTILKDADTTGVFRPSNGALYLKNSNSTGYADVAINYGVGGDYPVVGDWDGDGDATIGIYRNGVFYLRNANTIGYADIVFAFGSPGDQPIAGDWDGDGIDTVGVYHSSTITFYLRNSNSAGAPQMSFSLGNPGDVGIAGDWNGDGLDTTGVFRPSSGALYLKNTNATGYADLAINYGVAGDQPVTGDWNNDGVDTIGIYRNGMFYLRNANTIGYADLVFALGVPGDMPIAGNWDGLP